MGPGANSGPPRRAWVPRNRGPPCLPSRLLPSGERLGHPGPEAEEQDFAWPTLDSRWGKLGVDPVTPEDEVLEGWSGLRAGYPQPVSGPDVGAVGYRGARARTLLGEPIANPRPTHLS